MSDQTLKTAPTGEMMTAAFDYAQQGWQVLPCRESGDFAKAPHTRHGFKDATTNLETIRAWWSRWPNAMIGVAVPATLLVVDVDPRNGGSRQALEAIAGSMPESLTAWSGRGDGGHHLYFQAPHALLSQQVLPKGIDLKLPGKGYMIAPPSRHPATGQPYWWEYHPVAPCPGRLVELLRQRSVPQLDPLPRVPGGDIWDDTRVAGLVGCVARAPKGERNNMLNWATWAALEGAAPTEVYPLLNAAAQYAGLSEREANGVFESAFRAYQGQGATP